MLNKKEKFVILYLVQICSPKRAYLFFAENIAEFVSKKYLITISELNEIMEVLARENYIDLVVSNGKKGYYYCITLKSKAISYKREQENARKEFFWLMFKTAGLTVVSFVIGVLLKTIFKG